MMKRRSFLTTLSALAGGFGGVSIVTKYMSKDKKPQVSLLPTLEQEISNKEGGDFVLPENPIIYETILSLNIMVLDGIPKPQIIAKNEKINNSKESFTVNHTISLTAQYLGEEYGWFVG